MKKNNLLTLLGIFLLICSCNNEVINDENNKSSSSDKNLKAGQIEIRCYPYSNRVSFSIAAEKVTIDWGDDTTIEDATPNGVYRAYSHEFPNQNFRTITIYTESATSFVTNNGTYHELRLGDCPKLKTLECKAEDLTVLEIKKAESLATFICSSLLLTSLDLGSCPTITHLQYSGAKLKNLNVSGCRALETLYCGNNQLTSLNVSNCSALKKLDCSYNLLTNQSLNDIFKSLPTVESGEICIVNNPDYESCNKEIAEKKGWKMTQKNNNGGPEGGGAGEGNTTVPTFRLKQPNSTYLL
jgi:Leucine-rich repeat (LRR) protein